MKTDDPAKFDDPREKCWEPLQALWPIDDPVWMAKRLELWKNIEKNNYVKRFFKDELRGYKNLFLTGRQFEREYPYLSEAVRDMRVRYGARLALIPITEPCQYKLYTDQCTKSTANNWEYMQLTSFWVIAQIYENTGLANERVLDIYKHIMGGGELKDNQLLLSKNIENFESEMENELRHFFAFLNGLMPNSSGPYHFDEENFGWVWGLFEYYESISQMLCDYENIIRSKYFREKEERKSQSDYDRLLRRYESDKKKWAKRLDNIDKTTTTGNPEQDKVLFKVKELIHSDRFPEVYREFWREFGE